MKLTAFTHCLNKLILTVDLWDERRGPDSLVTPKELCIFKCKKVFLILAGRYYMFGFF